MNSNSYLSLSNHPVCSRLPTRPAPFGAGPGAVRFIDGTFAPHARLEARIARFVDRPAAARSTRPTRRPRPGDYARRTGHLLDWRRAQPQLHHPRDAHRQRALGAARDLQAQRPRRPRAAPRPVPDGTGRVIVIFDGIFSMRGDNAPVDAMPLVARHEHRFRDGVITVMDDSHGIAAYGATGRAPRNTAARRSTCSSARSARRSASTAASSRQPGAGRGRAAEVRHLHLYESARRRRLPPPPSGHRGRRRRGGPRRLANLGAHDAVSPRLEALGLESIPGPHPVVPLLVRDTDRVRAMVRGSSNGHPRCRPDLPCRAERRRDDPLSDQRRPHRGRHRRAPRRAQSAEGSTRLDVSIMRTCRILILSAALAATVGRRRRDHHRGADGGIPAPGSPRATSTRRGCSTCSRAYRRRALASSASAGSTKR